jgi:hypothetical protein
MNKLNKKHEHLLLKFGNKFNDYTFLKINRSVPFLKKKMLPTLIYGKLDPICYFLGAISNSLNKFGQLEFSKKKEISCVKRKKISKIIKRIRQLKALLPIF